MRYFCKFLFFLFHFLSILCVYVNWAELCRASLFSCFVVFFSSIFGTNCLNSYCKVLHLYVLHTTVKHIAVLLDKLYKIPIHLEIDTVFSGYGCLQTKVGAWNCSVHNKYNCISYIHFLQTLN